MTPIQWVVAVLGTGGIGKFLWDVVSALTQRKRNQAESAVILLNSATGYSSRLEKRLDEVTESFDKFRREQEDLNRENRLRWRSQDQLLLEHSRWDHQMVTRLKAKGIPVDEPPPLFLPIPIEGPTS